MTPGHWIFASGSALLLAIAAAAAQPASHGVQCFSSTQVENWRAPDTRTIYIRVRSNRYFRLDLAAECSTLRAPGAQLITTFGGSDMVCSALDWDLKVSAGLDSAVEPCLVKTMTQLAPAEVAALPKNARP